jgi:hypothetical protein
MHGSYVVTVPEDKNSSPSPYSIGASMVQLANRLNIEDKFTQVGILPQDRFYLGYDGKSHHEWSIMKCTKNQLTMLLLATGGTVISRGC